jgi:hypothetical protein
VVKGDDEIHNEGECMFLILFRFCFAATVSLLRSISAMARLSSSTSSPSSNHFGMVMAHQCLGHLGLWPDLRLVPDLRKSSVVDRFSSGQFHGWSETISN